MGVTLVKEMNIFIIHLMQCGINSTSIRPLIIKMSLIIYPVGVHI
jgi:hypothetical protein